MHISTIGLVLFCLYFISDVRTDVDGTIPYQSSCSLSTNNGNCSTNSFCKCATLVNGGNVCTQMMNCEFAAQCDANNACEKDGSVCVIDSRCPGKHLCYSTVLFGPELCPAAQAAQNNN